MACVSDDSDDGHPFMGSIEPAGEALADWVFVGKLRCTSAWLTMAAKGWS